MAEFVGRRRLCQAAKSRRAEVLAHCPVWSAVGARRCCGCLAPRCSFARPRAGAPVTLPGPGPCCCVRHAKRGPAGAGPPAAIYRQVKFSKFKNGDISEYGPAQDRAQTGQNDTDYHCIRPPRAATTGRAPSPSAAVNRNSCELRLTDSEADVSARAICNRSWQTVDVLKSIISGKLENH